MQPNKLMAAAIAVTASAGLAFSPIASAEEAPPVPTGQHGFFVPGHGGSDDPQNYIHPDTPFPIHFVDNGFSMLNVSTAAGVANLIESIKQNAAPHENFGDFVHVICYGAGCLVAHKTKPAFQEGGELEQYKLFDVTSFRDPANADGGILAKMPGSARVNQDDYQDATHETTVTHEYDIVSDAPDRHGVLAFLNSLAAAHYHGDDYGFDQLNSALNDGNVVVTVTTGEDGTTRSHYLIKATNLPLTRPLRNFFLAINNDAGDVKVNEAFDNLDDVLRPHIDSKYDKGPNPEVNQREVSTVNGTPFTPPPGPIPDEEPENEVVDNEDAQQMSFSAQVDNQDANRNSSLVDSEPPADVDTGDAGDTPPENSANTTSNSTVGEPDNKPTWKERMAEKRAEREERREQFKQNVKDTINSVRDALSPKKKDDNPSEGENNDDGPKNDNSDGSEGGEG